MIASRQVGQAPKSAEQQLDTNTNQLSDLKKAVEENKGKYTNGIKNKIINSIPEKYKNDFNNSIQGHTFNKKINNLELLYLKHTTDADTNKLEIQNILLDYIKSVNNTLLESVTDKAKLLKEVLTDNNINQNLRKQIVNSLITMQDIQRGGLDMAHNTFQTFISLFGGDNPNRISESAKIPLANTVDLILGQLDFNEGFDLCFGENAKKLNNLIESNHKELLGFGIVQLFMDQHKETIKEKMEITIKDSKKADPLNPSLNDLEIKFGDGGDAKLIANDNINRNNLLLYLKINHAYFRQQITPTILAALNSDISLVEREAEMDEQVRQIAKDAGIDLPQGIKHPLRAIISNPVLFLIMLGACIFNSDFRKKFFGPLGLALAIYDFGGGGDLLAGALGGAERTNADLVELMKQGDAWTKEKFNKHITEPLTNLVGINQDQLPPFLQSNERISQNPNTLFAYICADLSFAEINDVNNPEGLRGILDKNENFKRLVGRLDPAETVGLMEMVTIKNFKSFKTAEATAISQKGLITTSNPENFKNLTIYQRLKAWINKDEENVTAPTEDTRERSTQSPQKAKLVIRGNQYRLEGNSNIDQITIPREQKDKIEGLFNNNLKALEYIVEDNDIKITKLHYEAANFPDEFDANLLSDIKELRLPKLTTLPNNLQLDQLKKLEINTDHIKLTNLPDSIKELTIHGTNFPNLQSDLQQLNKLILKDFTSLLYLNRGLLGPNLAKFSINENIQLEAPKLNFLAVNIDEVNLSNASLPALKSLYVKGTKKEHLPKDLPPTLKRLTLQDMTELPEDFNPTNLEVLIVPKLIEWPESFKGKHLKKLEVSNELKKNETVKQILNKIDFENVATINNQPYIHIVRPFKTNSLSEQNFKESKLIATNKEDGNYYFSIVYKNETYILRTNFSSNRSFFKNMVHISDKVTTQNNENIVEKIREFEENKQFRVLKYNHSYANYDDLPDNLTLINLKNSYQKIKAGK